MLYYLTAEFRNAQRLKFIPIRFEFTLFQEFICFYVDISLTVGYRTSWSHLVDKY
jgi:hypothetical protein